MATVTFPAQSGVAVDRSDLTPMGENDKTIIVPNSTTFMSVVDVQGQGFLEYFICGQTSGAGTRVRITVDGTLIIDTSGGTTLIGKRELRTAVGSSNIPLSISYDGFNVLSQNNSNFEFFILGSMPITSSTTKGKVIDLPDSLYFKKSLLVQVSHNSPTQALMNYAYAGGYKS